MSRLILSRFLTGLKRTAVSPCFPPHGNGFFSSTNKCSQDPSFYLSPYVKTRKIPSNKVKQLLFYVVRGMQDEAELMLTQQPELACFSESAVDFSHRHFRVPALICARWARDWHMCHMLLKYIPPEEAKAQLIHLKTHGTAHGKQFEFTELIHTLQVYLDNFDRWSCYQLGIQWCEVIGMAQTRAPAHVGHQICHPYRSLTPLPDFANELVLPRSLDLVGGSKFFPLQPYPAGILGKDFAVFRWNKTSAGIGTMKPCPDARITSIVDLSAIMGLEKTCVIKCNEIESQFGLVTRSPGLA